MNSLKDKVFINIATEISTLSKCVSYKVGCIIVKDDRIISMGYNGSPAGYKNCDEQFPNYGKDVTPLIDQRDKHHKWSNMFEIHAEENAMIYAAKNGTSIDGAKMYCTLHPCNNCLKNICQSGIVEVIYKDIYDRFTSQKEIEKLLKTCNLKFRQY